MPKIITTKEEIKISLGKQEKKLLKLRANNLKLLKNIDKLLLIIRRENKSTI